MTSATNPTCAACGKALIDSVTTYVASDGKSVVCSEPCRLKMSGAKLYAFAGENITHCTSCGAQIFFKKLETGRSMPVDYPAGTTHFATCPNAGKHRKRDTVKK